MYAALLHGGPEAGLLTRANIHPTACQLRKVVDLSIPNETECIFFVHLQPSSGVISGPYRIIVRR
jgi:hypothetical protein